MAVISKLWSLMVSKFSPVLAQPYPCLVMVDCVPLWQKSAVKHLVIALMFAALVGKSEWVHSALCSSGAWKECNSVR